MMKQPVVNVSPNCILLLCDSTTRYVLSPRYSSSSIRLGAHPISTMSPTARLLLSTWLALKNDELYLEVVLSHSTNAV